MTIDHGPEQVGTGFDEVLRARRSAAGLTQADLADRAGVGVRTVRDIERGRATRPQRTTVELLATALGLTGRDRADFLATARGQSGPTGSRGPVNLPLPQELIGRDAEVAELAEIIHGAGSPAVLSLVGLAGVGKTSLALAVAHRVAEHYPGGVAGHAVTQWSSGSDVLAALAAGFGVGRADDLRVRLAGGQSLVLIDSVEQAPDAVAEALRWLMDTAAAPRVIATGRHPIGMPGERIWPVAPLEVPPVDAEPVLDSVDDYPAVALFLARLRQVRREPVAQEEVGALVGLVRRLAGLPLALELAAARGRLLDLNEILDRYGDRVLDLSGPPHASAAADVTLRDAVSASYRLLEPAERRVLRRLSAFRSRWSVELAGALLAEEPTDPPVAAPDPVPVLDRLLELGLLSMRGTGPFRFRLLDVVRDLAEERATARRELAAVRRRHAEVFAQLAEGTVAELAGASLSRAVDRLDHVASDLWAALAHAAMDDPHTALRLAAALPRWWRLRGRDVTGRHWLRRLLDDPRTADAPALLRARARLGLAQLALEHGAGPDELPAADAALSEFQAHSDVDGELAARNVLCALWMTTGGYDEARRHGEAALALATRSGRVRDMAVAQNNLTWHEIRVGDLGAARRRLAAVDRLAAQCDEDRLRALAVANLAEVARLDGRYAEAQALGRRAIAALEELGDPGHRRRVLGTIGLASAQDGRLVEAAAALLELRAHAGPPAEAADSPQAGQIAMIEANLAMRRGERELAVEWFTVAAKSYAGGHDLRDVAEALVGVVASADDPSAQSSARRWLASVCREGGITLLPYERHLIGEPV